MKRVGIVGRCIWAVVFGVWLLILIALWTSALLFFAGVLVPRVTVRTIIEGWLWVALVLLIVSLAVSGWKPGRLFDRPAFRGYAWSTLFVLSLVVLFYVVERWRGHREWQRLEVEMRGETLDLRGLEPFPVADEQNFAAMPVVAQWWDAAAPANVRGQLQKLADRVPEGGAGAWEIQERVDLEACLEKYVPSAMVDLRTNGASAEEFLAAWDVFEPEMAQLRAGTLRSHARFDLPYDQGMFDTTLSDRIALFKAIGQAFRLRAVAALRASKPAVAVSEVEHLLRISELVEQEPLLERQRLMLLHAAIQPVWEGLGNNPWSEAQLSVLQANLERPDLLAEYRRAVRKEYLLLVDMCEKLFPVRSSAAPWDPTEDDASRMLITGMRWFYPSGWLLQNLAGMHRLSYELRERATDPDANRVYVDVTRQIGRQWVYEPPSLDPFFATFIMPRAREIVEDATQRYAYAQCALDLASTACAIERYRIAHRQLPESLDLLVPNWMAAVPTDLIDGRPLRYRRLDAGRYLLYSAGWNQIDEGGKVAMRERPLEAWQETLQIKRDGDWVWTAAAAE